MMKVLILGGDGYLGWATAMYLSSQGHEVVVVDNYLRRNLCRKLDVAPLIDVPDLDERIKLWEKKSGERMRSMIGDVADYEFLSNVFQKFRPDTVVHYAEQPSAPCSMTSKALATLTVQNNLMSTLNVVYAVLEFQPECHIVKLGTMGEYGTPNIDIEEGYLDVVHNGRKQKFLYPKTPGSIYHLTKVQDSDLLYFSARTWGIAITDLNQGPVYGIETEEMENEDKLAPIFNYDEYFGTVLNRFLVQAVAGIPLTIYGKGGQTRGYINIKDTVRCVELALNNPADPSEFRVFNQFTETFTVNNLAKKVEKAGNSIGLKVKLQNIDNPRKELEKHYYNPKHTGLLELGLTPNKLTDVAIEEMLDYVQRYKNNINTDYILPKVKW